MMVLYIKSFHIIAMVAWFAGLFYLPRLFVYHADAKDKISLDRFNIMETRLYYAIMWPAAILTSVLGILLLSYSYEYYLKAPWMHAKLTFVLVLWGYHLSCGHFVKKFVNGKNERGTKFYRFFNEVPTLLLIAIVILVVVRP